MITFDTIGEAFRYFFFSPEPVATTGVFRIAIGLVLLVDSLSRCLDADIWFYPSGLGGRINAKTFNLIKLLGNTRGAVRFVLALYVFTALNVLLGTATFVFGPIAFMCIVTLYGQQLQTTSGSDSVLIYVTLLLGFMPADSCFTAFYDHNPHQLASPWALRTLQLQLSFVYLAGGLFKYGRLWKTGSALMHVLTVDGYRRKFIPNWLFPEWLLRWSSWGTIVLEVGFPLIFIEELRYPILIATILLHFGIEMLLSVQLFSFTMWSCLITFVRWEEFL